VIFYFHGFASSAKSWKVGLLKSNSFPFSTLYTPTLPVDPREVITLFKDTSAKKGKPKWVMGSSLGGFYAIYTSLLFDIPGILINPSLEPWISLKEFVGQHKRYYTNESFEWKAAYLDTLEEMGQEVAEIKSKQYLLHFFLSRDDEVLQLATIPDEFPKASFIKFYDNCQHSFVRFPEIIPEIKNLVQKKWSFPDL
jgi:predicted esterase YcpF (UPF0227 family)